MSWVITAIVSVGATTAYGQYQQGKIQENEYKRQANEAELEASGRELQRREQVNKRLAMNSVGQSMSGMKGDGTPKSIALKNAKDISFSEGMETLSDRLKMAQLRRAGTQAGQAGGLAAASTLLNAGLSAMGASGGASTAPKNNVPTPG